VALWDVRKTNEPISVARGAGSGLWGVALSNEGGAPLYLAFTDHRDPAATHPNRRGKGPERFFDLHRPHLESGTPANVKLVRPLESAGGWTVEPDAADPQKWFVVHAAAGRQELPWNRDMDDRPTCYTFLPQRAGEAVRLAVGHYWGFSLFELAGAQPRRVQYFTGHHGVV